MANPRNNSVSQITLSFAYIIFQSSRFDVQNNSAMHNITYVVWEVKNTNIEERWNNFKKTKISQAIQEINGSSVYLV